MRTLVLVTLLSSVAHAAPPASMKYVPLKTQIRYRLLQAKTAIKDLGAKAIGLVELTGARYPVTPYQHQVSQQLWRGSRLDADQIENLKQRGFSAVVSLTKESNSDKLPAMQDGLAYKRIPILDDSTPTMEQVKSFLDFVAKNSSHGPVYVHCEAGIGRTGIMVAAYRMAFEGMSAGDALRIPTQGDRPSTDPKQWGLTLHDQRAFVREVYHHLQSGDLKGYLHADGKATFGAKNG